ncbi:MAG TPA: DUF4153 domain-containing protein [Bacteroidia bacterium]|nr:DUF4153 domain-containing protein [Bacteroidia bacterium]
MKRNDWVYILCIALYSFLFYEQSAGLNFLIFSVVVVAGLGLMRPEAIRKKHWMVSAALVLISGTAVFLNGSSLAIAANMTSLMLFSAQSAAPGTSLIISFFLSACTIGGSYVFMIIDFFERRAGNPAEEKSEKKNSGRIWAVIVAVIIVLVFFLLYRSTNVLFKELTKHINLDWISWKWCLFTGIGAVAVYGVLFLRKFGGIGDNSALYQRNLEPQTEENANWGDSLMREDNERFLALLLFGLLNVLVLFVNGVDLFFQFGDGKMPEGITVTSYVHQGVGRLIVNVLLAMLLVLFFFRGRLNYNPAYKTIRALAILWLLQNVFMLFFMAGRNNLYAEMFGMTYKRIGVYFYLLLTAIGVLTTILKVSGKKTNTWLFRINTWLFFSVFVCSSLVSWARFITWYSLYKSDYVNRAYLSSLSYQSLPYLVELNLHPEKFSQKELNENYEDDDDLLYKVQLLMDRNWGNKSEFSVRLYRRIYKQLAESRDVDWRSSTYHTARVEKELLAYPMYGNDTVLFLEYSRIEAVYYFPGFSKVERLDIGNNQVTSIGELAQYPNLEHADFVNNQLTTLDGIEGCKKLTHLDVEGNTIKNWDALLKVPSLKWLNVSNPNDPKLDKLKRARPDLVIQ